MFEWNRDHPYEQESLHELIEARKYDVDASLVQVLDISAFPSTENTKSTQFILHIDESYELEKALGLEDGNIMGYRSRLSHMWKIWLQIIAASDDLQGNNYYQPCIENCGVF